MHFPIFFFVPIIYAQSNYPSLKKVIDNPISPCPDSKSLIHFHPYLRSPYPDFQKYELRLRLEKEEEEEEIEIEWIDT